MDRAQLVQMAGRRVVIVALARQLLIALWRDARTGLVPAGVRVA